MAKDPKEEEGAGTSTPQDAPKAEAAAGAVGKAKKGDDGKTQTGTSNNEKMDLNPNVVPYYSSY